MTELELCSNFADRLFPWVYYLQRASQNLWRDNIFEACRTACLKDAPTDFEGTWTGKDLLNNDQKNSKFLNTINKVIQ